MEAHANDVGRGDRRLGLAALAVVAAGCLLVLAPFLSTLLWAIIIAYSTWGLFECLTRMVRGRVQLAAALMTLLLAAVLVGPFLIVGMSLGENTEALSQAIQRLKDRGVATPPDWLAGLPLVGEKLGDLWSNLAADTGRLLGYVKQFAAPVGKWLVDAGIAFGAGLLHLSLSVLIAYFLYRDGDYVAARFREVMRRIGGGRAHHLVDLAGNTVKGVVHGILGSALAQGLVAGIGFWVAGIPGPFLLGLITCFLALIPVGPALIWVPATLWLFHQNETGWAIFMGVWGVLVISGIDNVVKPYLISRGGALPFIFVLLGVLGGALSFGVIGIFLGPTLLAVGYAILKEWTQSKSADAAGTVDH